MADSDKSFSHITLSSLEYIESLSKQQHQNLFNTSQEAIDYQKVNQVFKSLGNQNFQRKIAQQTTLNEDAKQYKIFQLLNAYRFNGHLKATLDPLKRPVEVDLRALTLAEHDLSKADLETPFTTELFSEPTPLKTIIETAERIYCGNIGFEYMHMTDVKEKSWLQTQIEGKYNTLTVDNNQKKWLLQRLIAAETFEKFLHTKYVGQKRFSLEGGESLIPLLNVLFNHAGDYGTRHITLGMAHRGRLNVLINIFGKQAELLFQEFAGNLGLSSNQTGDVKYHLGFSSDMVTPNGKDIHLTMAFNPSHLEIVGPVVVGYTRYHQEQSNDVDGKIILPILIHGDAAVAGQGVIMETLNMSQSSGYTTKGTVHVVINNQIGFTTSKQNDARSTYYCTDVMKMVNAPIFHVNGEDPEAVMFVSRLAIDYRMKFKKDVVIDLVCYRRHGHNEADEPAVTQPMMYRLIRAMKTTRVNYGEQLIAENVIDEAGVETMAEQYRTQLQAGDCVAENIVQAKKKNKTQTAWEKYQGAVWTNPYESAVPQERLLALAKKLKKMPNDFTIHSIVMKTLEDRLKMAKGEIDADWGFAETMAYATLADEGVSMRLSGQDCGRGTFFHRHAVLHNQNKLQMYIPLQHLHSKQGKVQVIDSVLSEEAVLAFEFGYAIAYPESLVIWEAQFGDFVNGAQAIIDQFITSAEIKWGRLSNLVMMLPHGLEGQGPEHSSGRLERFMQACAKFNIQVCVPSTASQIFHLLRRQMLRVYRKPLIIMTPKGLLRNKLAASPLHKFTSGQFQVVIQEQYKNIKPLKVNRVVLCSGKVFYDLLNRRQKDKINDIAILRIEQLYPFSFDALKAELKKFPNAKTVVWCQEEPINQGAWYTTRHNFVKSISKKQELFVVARALSAAPAEGSLGLHNIHQNELIEQALAIKAIENH